MQTVAIFDGFMARKAACEGRLVELKAAAQVQQRLNKALRVGRVPDLVVRVLNAVPVVRNAGVEGVEQVAQARDVLRLQHPVEPAHLPLRVARPAG